jgi:excisionase family DNA binding protein
MSLEHAPQRQKHNGAAYLTAPQVRARYGSISDMTLYRWVHDPRLGFVQPIVINGRRYFPEDELDTFDAKRAASTNEAA